MSVDVRTRCLRTLLRLRVYSQRARIWTPLKFSPHLLNLNRREFQRGHDRNVKTFILTCAPVLRYSIFLKIYYYFESILVCRRHAVLLTLSDSGCCCCCWRLPYKILLKLISWHALNTRVHISRIGRQWIALSGQCEASAIRAHSKDRRMWRRGKQTMKCRTADAQCMPGFRRTQVEHENRLVQTCYCLLNALRRAHTVAGRNPRVYYMFQFGNFGITPSKPSKEHLWNSGGVHR